MKQPRIRPTCIRISKRYTAIQKKDEWNSRFVLEKIPQYNALNDKNCLAFQTYMLRKHKKHKRILIKSNVRPITSSNTNRNQNKFRSNINTLHISNYIPQKKEDLYTISVYSALVDEFRYYWNKIALNDQIQSLSFIANYHLRNQFPLYQKKLTSFQKGQQL